MPFILCFLLLLLFWLLGCCSIVLIFGRTTTISTHFCISGFLLIFLFLALHSHLLAPTFNCDVSFCGCQWLLLLIFLVLLLRLSLREINWHFRASSYTHTPTHKTRGQRAHTHTRGHTDKDDNCVGVLVTVVIGVLIVIKLSLIKAQEML